MEDGAECEVECEVVEDEEEVLEVECEEVIQLPFNEEVEVEVEVEVDTTLQASPPTLQPLVTAPSTVQHRRKRPMSHDGGESNPKSRVWACCDVCGKWRRLGATSTPPQGWWVCSMLTPESSVDMGACDVPQEELSDDESEDEAWKLPEGVAGRWVQCDACTKWRSLPTGTIVGDGRWVCSMNPRSSHNRCEVPEEELGEDEMEEADAALVDAEEAADSSLQAVEDAQRAALLQRNQIKEAKVVAKQAKEALALAEAKVERARARVMEADGEAAEESTAAAAAERAAAEAAEEAARQAAEERRAAAAAWIAARNEATMAAAQGTARVEDADAHAAGAVGDVAHNGTAAGGVVDEAMGDSADGLSTSTSAARVGGAPPRGLTEAEGVEVVARAEAAKRGSNQSMVVHGWHLTYVLRPPGSSSRGDIYMVCACVCVRRSRRLDH